MSDAWREDVERRLVALEALVKDMAQGMAELAESLDTDAPAPAVTLDGDDAGCERDQDEVL